METLCKAKKLQAQNNYKIYFLQNLLFQAFTLIALTLTIILLFFPSLPIINRIVPNYSYSTIFSPKCLFIVFNVIVVFLVGDSKINIFGSVSSSASTSDVDEIYDEYVEKIGSLRKVSTTEETKQELESNNVKEMIEISKEEEMEEEFQEAVDDEVEEEESHQEQAQQEEEEEEEEEEENGITAVEELNKRIEDFIARVNRERWLEEARLFASCKA